MRSILAALKKALSQPTCLEYGLLILVLLIVLVILAVIYPPAAPTIAATLVASVSALIAFQWGHRDPDKKV